MRPSFNAMATASVRRMKLGSQGLEVSAQGLGCFGMSGFYGSPKPEPEMISLIHHAINSGVTFFDTSEAYGPRTNEILLGKALKGGMREKVELATKFGINHGDDGKMEIRGDPAYVRAACEGSLNRLGVDYIDLYYQHRIDTRVPIEVTVCPSLNFSFNLLLYPPCQKILLDHEQQPLKAHTNSLIFFGVFCKMGELKKLVEEGKIKYIGLSEASASTIRRAHAVHPITAVQLEWSLWARDVEEEIVPTCRELGIGIVAYSPLGRGFLSSGPKLIDSFSKDDVRQRFPRFQPENLDHNKLLFERLSEIATKKGCTPSQLALAWIHHQGDDVCPIPGTTKI
ncbi:hypothetical protein Patl1_24192 [Pistacia atlantica]|uniref:Uncharacterized protein n=1 Tax=Pistacia atlantica TaxID=434234 RepID=A0ACC1A080_9ROSI|nr:hypothetical protein Patl1_24192 [Pistacia atlantica]